MGIAKIMQSTLQCS